MKNIQCALLAFILTWLIPLPGLTANTANKLNPFSFPIHGIESVHQVRFSIDTVDTDLTIFDPAADESCVLLGAFFSEGGAAHNITFKTQSDNLMGSVSTTSSDATITGTGTTFTSDFKSGDRILVNTGDTLTIASITSNTEMEATGNATASVSGQTYQMERDYILTEHAANQGMLSGAGNGILMEGPAGHKLLMRSSAAVSSGMLFIGTPQLYGTKSPGVKAGE